jgi:hypothetical protein
VAGRGLPCGDDLTRSPSGGSGTASCLQIFRRATSDMP